MSTKQAENNSIKNKFLRIKDIVSPKGILPICRSSFYSGIKRGIYPKPIKLGSRISLWRTEDIANLVSAIEEGRIS